jgi:IS1 family transposase
MNRLSVERRAALASLLVEGNRLRAVSRIADVSINTVSKLLVDLGEACSAYQNDALRGIHSRRVQCDEIWSFVYAKAKNVPTEKRGTFGYGDVWTWTGIDADSKLMISWRVGARDAVNALEFMKDLAGRIANRVQLTTDEHKPYLSAVEETFGADIDYSMLVKLYGPSPDEETRYSPAKCIGCIPQPIMGNPDPAFISTSYVERQNLTMRMSMRRFTRLTNGFSKKLENHIAAISLHYMYYNFGRIHKTLRCTPAMAAGISDHIWSLDEIARLSN